MPSIFQLSSSTSKITDSNAACSSSGAVCSVAAHEQDTGLPSSLHSSGMHEPINNVAGSSHVDSEQEQDTQLLNPGGVHGLQRKVFGAAARVNRKQGKCDRGKEMMVEHVEVLENRANGQEEVVGAATSVNGKHRSSVFVVPCTSVIDLTGDFEDQRTALCAPLRSLKTQVSCKMTLKFKSAVPRAGIQTPDRFLGRLQLSPQPQKGEAAKTMCGTAASNTEIWAGNDTAAEHSDMPSLVLLSPSTSKRLTSIAASSSSTSDTMCSVAAHARVLGSPSSTRNKRDNAYTCSTKDNAYSMPVSLRTTSFPSSIHVPLFKLLPLVTNPNALLHLSDDFSAVAAADFARDDGKSKVMMDADQTAEETVSKFWDQQSLNNMGPASEASASALSTANNAEGLPSSPEAPTEAVGGKRKRHVRAASKDSSEKKMSGVSRWGLCTRMSREKRMQSLMMVCYNHSKHATSSGKKKGHATDAERAESSASTKQSLTMMRHNRVKEATSLGKKRGLQEHAHGGVLVLKRSKKERVSGSRFKPPCTDAARVFDSHLYAAKKTHRAKLPCIHKRRGKDCKDYKSSGTNVHWKRRRSCIDCGGSEIYDHNKRRYRCNECDGGGICEHYARRDRCKICRV